MKLRIEMSRALFVALLLSTTLVPMASAHGANDFSIIMRGSSIQPGVAEVMQNDSITFYNVADTNRTIRVDRDGDGEYDSRCETEATNSSSIKDECSIILDWDNWPAERYYVDIFENGTLWKTLSLIVTHDYHEEEGPPTGYSFNSEDTENDDSTGINDGLLAMSVMLILVFLVVVNKLMGVDE
jgi:hypothetical protein